MSQLKQTILNALQENFEDASVEYEPDEIYLAKFKGNIDEVGDLYIEEDSEEAIVFIGQITHRHFYNYDDEKNENEKALAIAQDIVNFLNELFSDKIEFYGYGTGGGSRERSSKSRGFWSKLFLGKQSYIWSGALNENNT